MLKIDINKTHGITLKVFFRKKRVLNISSGNFKEKMALAPLLNTLEEEVSS